MNVTFLIGNGFDLNLGLKTKYTDFLAEYRNISCDENSSLGFFRKELLKDEKLWSNAEIAFGAITKNFKEHKEKYTAEEYCMCHEDFCNNLAKYLIAQEQQIKYIEQTSRIVNGFSKGILNYNKGFREAEKENLDRVVSSILGEIEFNFINFNYTQTLDMCVSAVKKVNGILGKRTTNSIVFNRIGKVLHVHGTVDKDMVLGVNDISQIGDNSLFSGYDDEFINQIIKIKTNEMNGEHTDEKVFRLLKSSDLIYIYGMACGATDKLWWGRICDIMNKNKKLHLIIHKFDAPEDGLIRRNFLMFVKNVRKEFTGYCDFDEETKSEIQSRIHVDRTNIFEGLRGLAGNDVNIKNRELATV